jgi:hypothetical protein
MEINKAATEVVLVHDWPARQITRQTKHFCFDGYGEAAINYIFGNEAALFGESTITSMGEVLSLRSPMK